MAEYTNIYKGKTLISRAEVAYSNWQKCKGLMFSRQKDILFNFRKDAYLKFHMVFVFYPIDIIFMDHDKRIVDLKKRFCPFTFYYSKARSSHVLEVAKGTIENYGLNIGDLMIITTADINKELDRIVEGKKTIRAAKKKKAPLKKDKPKKTLTRQKRTAAKKTANDKKAKKKPSKQKRI